MSRDADRIVGARIAQLRKEVGISRHELAIKVGKSRRQVGRYEEGSARLSVGVLVGIAHALQVPVTQLMEGFLDDETLRQHRCASVLQSFLRIDDHAQQDKACRMMRLLAKW